MSNVFGHYFWKDSVRFDLISTDSTTNGAGMGNAKNCTLSEKAPLPSIQHRDLALEMEHTLSQLKTYFSAMAKSSQKAVWRIQPRRSNNLHLTLLTDTITHFISVLITTNPQRI